MRYLARQPILDSQLNIHGYELLFRSGPEQLFRCDNPETAADHTIDFSLLFGSSAFTNGHIAFVKCTRNILLREVITILPRDKVVIEVQEDVVASQEILAACERLHRAGYLVALDDYVPTPNTQRLLPFADIVKVDFLATDTACQAAIAADMRSRGICLLAKKVETREQFHFAQHLGYRYFQGYFFCRPENLTVQDIPDSKHTYLQVLNIANGDCFDVDKLEEAILREPTLRDNLLRYLNSASVGLSPIHSMRHALSLIGRRELRKWVSISVAISLCSDRPQELIYRALVRARCCEGLVAHCREDCSGAFIVGLMSLMDAVLDCPMEVVISQLPLTSDCNNALRGIANALGTLLRVAVCCERGAWEEISSFARGSDIPEVAILELHRDACRWADGILKQHRRHK